MKNENPSGRKLSFTGPFQRIAATILILVFIWLIWAAYSHQYDNQVNRFAAWLQQHYETLRRLF